MGNVPLSLPLHYSVYCHFLPLVENLPCPYNASVQKAPNHPSHIRLYGYAAGILLFPMYDRKPRDPIRLPMTYPMHYLDCIVILD